MFWRRPRAPKPIWSLLLDHDDSEREFEYRSDPMLELARERAWEIVSMKSDFAEMFQDDCLLPD